VVIVGFETDQLDVDQCIVDFSVSKQSHDVARGDKNVSGIVIAADYDNKLEYALRVLQNVQVFLYKVSFTLDELKGKQKFQ
jgi:hypothetical protein